MTLATSRQTSHQINDAVFFGVLHAIQWRLLQRDELISGTAKRKSPICKPRETCRLLMLKVADVNDILRIDLAQLAMDEAYAGYSSMIMHLLDVG